MTPEEKAEKLATCRAQALSIIMHEPTPEFIVVALKPCPDGGPGFRVNRVINVDLTHISAMLAVLLQTLAEQSPTGSDFGGICALASGMFYAAGGVMGIADAATELPSGRQ